MFNAISAFLALLCTAVVAWSLGWGGWSVSWSFLVLAAAWAVWCVVGVARRRMKIAYGWEAVVVVAVCVAIVASIPPSPRLGSDAAGALRIWTDDVRLREWDAFPAGTIVFVCGRLPDADAGWHECDGSTVGWISSPSLFEAVGVPLPQTEINLPRIDVLSVDAEVVALPGIQMMSLRWRPRGGDWLGPGGLPVRAFIKTN